ncbi:MAG: hypothetical protein L0Z62_15305 [Gemmataceae bacterium]|nr:hypothetical protein [Gemmataceae bacterium]
MCQRLAHDCCWEQAFRMLELVGHLLREEEQRDLLHEAYQVLRDTINLYESRKAREARR